MARGSRGLVMQQHMSGSAGSGSRRVLRGQRAARCACRPRPGRDAPSASAALHPSLCCPQAFSPCELFQRIRGRTLWFMGDSQTWCAACAARAACV